MRVALKALQDAGIVCASRGRYEVEAGDFSADAAALIAEAYRRRAGVDHTKLEQLMAYAYSARCRWKNVLEYFGESPDWERCGSCDNCRQPSHAVASRASAIHGAAGGTTGEGTLLVELGQRVSVPRYGVGTVMSICGEAVTVACSDGVTRRFVDSFVSLAP